MERHHLGVQGNGDSKEGDPVWKTFGENTAQLWDALRDTIGVSAAPIIDQGSSTKSQLKSGKSMQHRFLARQQMSSGLGLLTMKMPLIVL